MGVRCGWGLVAASPLWVFRGPDLPAHELPIRFMGARREKIRGCLCRKLCRSEPFSNAFLPFPAIGV